MKSLEGFVINESSVTGTGDMCGIAYDLIGSAEGFSGTMSMASIVIAPGESSMRHFHRRMEEIYYIVEGSGEMLLGDKVFQIGPGAAIFIPVLVVHQLRNTGANRLKLISVDCPPFDLRDVYEA
jgi:mannose-6-phosphate isomerase-like protein (cupin superfamily)